MHRRLIAHGTLAWALVCLSLAIVVSGGARPGQRSFDPLSADQLSALVALRDPLRNLQSSDVSSHLAKILIPRPADSENNTIVRNYIASRLKALDWHIEEDSFTDNTPYGVKRFTNVIATKDPRATRRLILAAHHDSKFFPSSPQNQFVGATDSAASCAIMLDLAESLDPLLNARRERLEDGLEDDEDVAETTLQLVFFDGEEAFKSWTHTDSIYGAKHLAEKWSTAYIDPHSKRRLLRDPVATELSTIEHMVLLDLLGAANPSVRSYFPDTGWLYDQLIDAERRLGENGYFNQDGQASTNWASWFSKRSGQEGVYSGIEDDHLPFLQRGINILHLIPNPFPTVWHRISDDASALDLPSMLRWNILLRVFLSEYLNLRPEVKTRPRSDDELH